MNAHHDELLQQIEVLKAKITSLENSNYLKTARLNELESLIDNSEKKYRLLVENANDAIFIAQDGYAKFPNPKALEMVGYSKKELETIPYLNFIHPEDRAFAVERKEKKHKGNNIPATYTIRIINRSGKEVWVQLNTAQILWDDKPATINFMRDITEQKILEEQLQQASKMEAIGTLAGGIAHDFNNILYPIVGHAEMLNHDNPEDSAVYNSSMEILKATKRAKNLVQQILTFCRKTSEEKKQIQLQPIIKESLKLLRSSIPSTIEFEVSIDETCSAIMGDATQIHRVIMNLCTNSFQAMEKGGGKLTVKLSQESASNRMGSNFAQGNFIQITVADTGSGMEKHIQDRLFDPYFTTKANGTGLGLSVVHGIVKSHGGEILVTSQKGKGTEFTVVIPTCGGGIAEKPAVLTHTIPRGSESILFVDDDEQIASLGKAMLTKLGYQVTSITDSALAFEIFKAQPQKFNLVLTDLTMPNLTGDQLAKKILQIRETLPIILCTGYGEKIYSIHTNPKEFRALIRKPILMSKLAQCIREVLDSTKNEKRRFQRYAVNNATVILPADEPLKLGEIINISRGGLSFGYIDDDMIIRKKMIHSISIKSGDQKTNIDHIPCAVIYHSGVSDSFTSCGTLKRCAVRFDNLNQTQMNEIQYFIENNSEPLSSVFY